jgi:TRAP-type mannitol/chloroaromatic compound transport system substrate-binding protein
MLNVPPPLDPQGEGPMTKITRRSLSRGGALGLAGALSGTFAAPALAQSGRLRWRMVTSWPKRLPGPGMSAERVASRIVELSGGRLEITVSAAGEVAPAFEVLDAVGSGVAEMGHTAAFYWQGKEPATAFFTTVPFGLLPNEHMAWVYAGGGQDLWDELYAPFGVRPFMAGNTGVCMGGWFRRELKSSDDVRGLKVRSLGLGGEVYRRLGAVAQTTSPGEILVALQSGVIDGVEFVGPGSDIALGLYRFAPFYYGPGFNKPNGTGECIVGLKAWQTLDAELQAIASHACAAEAAFALAEMERLNIEALATLTARGNAQLRTFPPDLIAAARTTARDVLGELGAKSSGSRKVHDSYMAFRDKVSAWSRISLQAVLEAREG